MAELFESNLFIIFVSGSLLLVIVYLLLSIRKQKKESNDQNQMVRNAEKELTKVNNQLLEVRSVVIGLGQKVSEQQDVIQHLSERVAELENVDADSRLYSRANKMVQLGAGVNELIEECELPKAEAELMLALQSKISGKKPVPPMDIGIKKKR